MKKLQREIRQLKKSPVSGCVFNYEKNNIFTWKCMGPEESPYQGGCFMFDMAFPTDYPFKAPKIKFKTKIYHPSIDAKGDICLKLLKDEWAPSVNCRKILETVISVLAAPDPNGAINNEAAGLLKKDEKAFRKKAAEMTEKEAM